MDSNHRPHAYQACALTSWAISPFFKIRQPPALPCRLQHSTIGRPGLNHRVRDGNGCVPWAHRHRKSLSIFLQICGQILWTWIIKQCFLKFSTSSSLERRWSSRTFRYGYLVTTSPQLSVPPSAAPSVNGWVTDFGRYQLPWCDGRCVQDPGTYSPRHSDSRLLAIPASCSRVADCSPNWDVIFGICSTSRSRFSLYRPL